MGMIRMDRVAIYLLGLAMCASAQPVSERWREHVKFWADDQMEGQSPGSVGHRLAAEYAAGPFAQIGLTPAGTNGRLQPILFDTRWIDASGSRLTMIAGGEELKLTPGKEAVLSARVKQVPAVRAAMILRGTDCERPRWDMTRRSG